MTTILNTEDGTLDAFVQTYCQLKDITLDGDVFGMLFSDKANYTGDDAAAIIEEAADIYRLHITWLADILDNRVAIAEARFGKAAAADVGAIADQLLGERGLKADWFIETGVDLAGATFWSITISCNRETLIHDYFDSREEAEAYVRSFTNVTPIDGE